MNTEKKRNYHLIFSSTLLAVIVIFFASVIKTRNYNLTMHDSVFSGPSLFAA